MADVKVATTTRRNAEEKRIVCDGADKSGEGSRKTARFYMLDIVLHGDTGKIYPRESPR